MNQAAEECRVNREPEDLFYPFTRMGMSEKELRELAECIERGISFGADTEAGQRMIYKIGEMFD